MPPDKPALSSILDTLRKEYIVIGTRRVTSLHAWSTIGLVLVGVTLGISLVANQSGRLDISQAQVAADTTTGLVGYWKFDEGSGTSASDSSGNNNNGTLVGAPAWVAGDMSGALSFNGSGYISVASPGSGVLDFGTSVEFSMSAWVKTTVGGYVISKTLENNAYHPGYFLAVDSSGVTGAVRDIQGNRCYVKANYPVTDGSWHHVAAAIKRNASCSADDILVYVDGYQRSASVSLGGALTNANVTNSEPFYIGAVSSCNASVGCPTPIFSYYTGAIDDARIYSRALALPDIQALYIMGGGTGVNPLTITTLSNGTRLLTAGSCNQIDVQQGIFNANDGDTVQIPAGTCTWTQGASIGYYDGGVRQTFTKSITLQGAGMDQTIIINNVPGAGMISYLTKLGGLSRISGMTLDSSKYTNIDPNGYNPGIIGIGGASQTFRVDHIHFINAVGHGVTTDGDHLFGVIDHNVFDRIGHGGSIYVFHGSWSGQTNGDGSWTEPAYWGTEKAVYIEDNTFNHDIATGGAPWVLDGWSGARAVLRYNTLTNMSPGGYHGLDSAGRGRSARSAEIYNNKISIDDPQHSIKTDMRGGSFLVFNNTVTDPQAVPGYYGVGFWGIHNYRDFEPFSYGKCDGTSPWDLNDPTIYATGTYSGTGGVYDNNFGIQFTFSGVNWTSNQWQGYYLHDITKNQAAGNTIEWSALITGNTSSAITVTSVAIDRAGTQFSLNNGDSYKIIRPLACMDNRGRGKGDLISGDFPPYGTGVINTATGIASWPNQVLEPTYGWNNTLNGAPDRIYSQNPWGEKDGRDYYSNTPMPGYTPYVYPHPLVSGSTTLPPPPPSDTIAPSVPTGLVASVVSSTQINLSWSASTDPSSPSGQVTSGVVGYKVFRNGTQVGTVSVTNFSNTGLAASTAYSYTVAAYDAAGNTSAQSASVSATTLAPTPTPSTNKFIIGDRVQTTSKLNVRLNPGGGKPLGSQQKGAKGTVTLGPQTSGTNIWYKIDYDTGVDGWSVQDYLVKI